MITLGIDTSNYATSLAVYSTDAEGVVCDKKQFLQVKPGERGLRQADALFMHTKALPMLLEQLSEECDFSLIDAVGVSTKPRPEDNSFMPCFLAGISTAKAFALAKGIKLFSTTHQQGHIAAAIFSQKSGDFFEKDFYAFHFSGGTSELLRAHGMQILGKIGTSLDLYAGQAVDRIGVRLGFAFPAGENVSLLALKCEQIIEPKVSVKGSDCSFSGLENQCSELLSRGLSKEYICKYCLSYIAFTAIKMLNNAKKLNGDLPVICAGGVMSSAVIQQIIKENVANAFFAPAKLSSDNAIGVAIIASREAQNG